MSPNTMRLFIIRQHDQVSQPPSKFYKNYADESQTGRENVFLGERFSIGHGPTPLAYVPMYVRTFHSTPHHKVEWNKYWVAQQKWFHSTHVRTYVQMYIALHSHTYLCTSVLSTPLHITEWSGTKKEYKFIQKARGWKKSPDAEKAWCWKYCQTLKKPDAKNK